MRGISHRRNVNLRRRRDVNFKFVIFFKSLFYDFRNITNLFAFVKLFLRMSTETIIKVELATSEALYKGAMAIRKQVFVKEQRIPESKEFDGNDFCAAHVVAYVQKNNRRLPIGTMRIRFFSDFVKFERMAVIRNFRKTNVAEDIMQYGLKYVAEKGYRQVYGMCKQELLPRWQQCGYHEIPGAERIEQNGMVLIPISLDLKENPQAIKMTSHPSLLTALEGHWHEKMQEVRKSSMMKAIFWKLKKIRQEHFNL